MYWDYWQQVMVDIGVVFGGVFEETLMMWICIQFYMFPLNFMLVLRSQGLDSGI